MVACLKRLLPVGLNLFAGREQEIVQHCKEKYLAVSAQVHPSGHFAIHLKLFSGQMKHIM